MTERKSALVAFLGILASVHGTGPAAAQAPPVTYQLTVIKAGSAGGTVIGNIGAINCGPTCVDGYAADTAIVLTATPEPSAQFTGWLGPCSGLGPCSITIGAATTAVATFSPTSLGAPGLDIDGSASHDALTDGLLIIRFLFGVSDAELITGAVGPGATRTSAQQITSYLADIKPVLDIDGNGQAEALTDGLLIIRHLFGLRGDSLVAGVVGAGALRASAPDIELRIQALQPPGIPVLGNIGLHTDRAVTQTIGAAGGMLTTTDAGGVVFTLAIPPFALKAQTAITMIPLQSVQSPPPGGSLAAGAHFLPEGLKLLLPATLTVDFPSAPGGEFVPFAYAGDLVAPHLYPAGASAQQVQFDVVHFSGYAAFAATEAAQLLGWFAPPSAVGDAALQTLVTASLTLSGTERSDAMLQALQTWLDDKIKPDTSTFLAVETYDPGLFVLGSPALLRDEMNVFNVALKFVLLQGVQAAGIAAIDAQFRPAVKDAAKHAIAKSNAGCSLSPASAVPVIAPDILGWQTLASATSAEALDSSLSRENVLANLCVQVAYDPNGGISFPTGITPGQAGTVMIRAGYTVNGGSVRFDQPMHITIGGDSNVEPAGLFAFDVAAGASAQKTFQWIPDTTEMRVDVEACIGNESLRALCQSAFVIRGGETETFGCQEYSARLGLQMPAPSRQKVQLFDPSGSLAIANGGQGGVDSWAGINGEAKSIDFYKVNAPNVAGTFQAVVRYRAVIVDHNPDFPGGSGSVTMTWTGGSQVHTGYATYDRVFPITLKHGDVVKMQGLSAATSAEGIGVAASYSIWLDQLPANVGLITANCN